MKLVDTIIVHSILQGGPGVPIFSPGIYYYLAKGDVEYILSTLAHKEILFIDKKYIPYSVCHCILLQGSSTRLVL